HFDLAAADEQTNVSFDVTPPQSPARVKMRVVAQVGAQNISSGIEVIQYPHILAQTLLPSAETTLLRADIKTLAKTIGYVMGPGDEVPQALRQMGCEVTLLTRGDVEHGDLSRYEAIVTGVRAFETRPELFSSGGRLAEYATNGGTLIIQQNQVSGN